MSESSACRTDSTSNFFSLTPEKVLASVEKLVLRCTGRCAALNSMENRVYEVEIEVDESEVRSPSDRFRVVKFYRPGRWSDEQILDEHDFLLDLQDFELPVIAPLECGDGGTLMELEELGVYAAVFPKRGGRLEPELNEHQLRQLGRLLARMHNVGESEEAGFRIPLTPETYGRNPLSFLQEQGFLPPEMADVYSSVVRQICDITASRLTGVQFQRIHGDCHVGNILWADEQPLLLDFDDMVSGPPVQDIWLILPGRDAHAQQQRDTLLSGYQQFRDFDRGTLNLVEGLRALRMIHFTAWIARRWDDPTFPRGFPQFGTPNFWRGHLVDLQEQLSLLQGNCW